MVVPGVPVLPSIVVFVGVPEVSQETDGNAVNGPQRKNCTDPVGVGPFGKRSVTVAVSKTLVLVPTVAFVTIIVPAGLGETKHVGEVPPNSA